MKPGLISWEEAEKYKYHSTTLLVDLREPEMYEKEHISGAWNISFDELEERMPEIMNYERIIFYCAHGNHSLKAAKLLAQKGKWACSIAGGYEGRYRKRR